MFGFSRNRRISINEGIEAFSKDPSARLLDVRTPEEYRSGHIPGSINLPVDDIMRAESLLPDKGTPLYVYCLSGMRSGAASRSLERMGYQKVANIGGIGAYRGRLERKDGVAYSDSIQ